MAILIITHIFDAYFDVAELDLFRMKLCSEKYFFCVGFLNHPSGYLIINLLYL